MEDGKGQSIFLSIIGIATLLVAVVGATFAWFSINVSGNEDSSGMIFYTNNLGQVNFTDGKEINLELAPGVFTTKEFTVEQTDPSAVGQIKYNIVLNVVSNTLTPNADGQFVHSLTSTGNTNGGTLGSFESTEVPVESTIIASGVIEGYESHKYTYTIGLNNIDADQNAAQGKTFNGYLSVQAVNEPIKK